MVGPVNSKLLRGESREASMTSSEAAPRSENPIEIRDVPLGTQELPPFDEIVNGQGVRRGNLRRSMILGKIAAAISLI